MDRSQVLVVGNRLTGYQVLALTLPFLANLFSGVLATLMSVYLPATVQDLMGTLDPVRLGHIGSYVGSFFIVGWAAGGVVFGWLGDRFGRIRVFSMAVLTYAVFTLLASRTSGWYELVVCRFVTGIGIGGTMVLSAVVVAESWHDRYRAIGMSIVSVGFPIGIIMAGLINYQIPDWRTGFLIGLFPLAVGGIAAFMLREPEQNVMERRLPRHLGHEWSQLAAPENRFRFFIGATIFGAMLVGLWATFSWLPSWVQTLLDPNQNGQKERGLSMMVMGMGGIAGGVVSGFLANTLGRKKTLMLAFGGSFAASFLLFRTNTVYTDLVLMQTAFLAVFFGISQGILTVYIPELFPTSIRATATGISFNAGRIVTATAVFFIGILVTILGGYGNAILAFSFTYLIGLVAVFFGEETKGKSLT